MFFLDFFFRRRLEFVRNVQKRLQFDSTPSVENPTNVTVTLPEMNQTQRWIQTLNRPNRPSVPSRQSKESNSFSKAVLARLRTRAPHLTKPVSTCKESTRPGISKRAHPRPPVAPGPLVRTLGTIPATTMT